MSSQINETNTLSEVPDMQPLYRCSNYIVDINLISNLPYCNRCNLYYKPSIRIENELVTYYCIQCHNIVGYIDNSAYPISQPFNLNNDELIWLRYNDGTIILSYNNNWHPYIISSVLNSNTSFLYLYVPSNYMLVRANDGFMLHEVN